MDVLIALVVEVAAVLSSLRRHPEPVARARTLGRAGMTLMALSLVSMGLFVALQDPGGWAWVGAIAAALVPLGAVAVLAWRWPALAVPPLIGLTALAVAAIAVEGDVGRFEGVGAVASAALAGAAVGATALGHRRARTAGLMLLAVGLAPIIVGTQTVYMAPAVAGGALYVLADHLARRAPTPRAGAPAPNRPREAT